MCLEDSQGQACLMISLWLKPKYLKRFESQWSLRILYDNITHIDNIT